MKHFILVFLLFSSTLLFGQTVDSLGTGNNSFLNKSELYYFDSIFQNAPGTNFKDQKIVFVDHRWAPRIISKKEFFDIFIIPFRNKNSLPNMSTKSFSDEDKKLFGSYNLMFISPSGSCSSKEKKDILKQLDSQK